MKLTIFGIIALSLLLCVTSNDLNVGKNEPGDTLVASRRLFRNAVPNKPMIAWSGYNADGNITVVKAVNAAGSDANIKIIKGGPGTSSVAVMAISKIGSGIDVQLNIYAKLNVQTTPA